MLTVLQIQVYPKNNLQGFRPCRFLAPIGVNNTKWETDNKKRFLGVPRAEARQLKIAILPHKLTKEVKNFKVAPTVRKS